MARKKNHPFGEVSNKFAAADMRLRWMGVTALSMRFAPGPFGYEPRMGSGRCGDRYRLVALTSGELDGSVQVIE